MSSQNRTRILLMLTVAGISMGQFIVFAVLAPLIRSVGLQEVHGGLILSFSSIIFALSSGVWGRLSSVYGRKKVMLIGLWGYSIGTLLFGMVFWLGLNKLVQGSLLFAMLCISRMLQSTLMGAASPAALAYMADITSSEQRVKGMGLLGSANSLGTILGPALAAPLILLHLLAPLLAASLFIAVTALLISGALINRPPLSSRQRVSIPREVLHTLRSYFDTRYASILLIGVLMFMSYAMCQQTVGYLIQDRLQISESATAGILSKAFICSAVCALIAQLVVVSKLRLTSYVLLLIGLPAMLLGYLQLLWLSQGLDAYIAFSFVGFGFGLAFPGFSSAASLSVSAEEQGQVAGVIAGAPALGYILGPTVGALLYQFSQISPYIAAAAINLALCITITMKLKGGNNRY